MFNARHRVCGVANSRNINISTLLHARQTCARNGIKIWQLAGQVGRGNQGPFSGHERVRPGGSQTGGKMQICRRNMIIIHATNKRTTLNGGRWTLKVSVPGPRSQAGVPGSTHA